MDRATLIHNPASGEARATGAELRYLVASLGLTVDYVTTDQDLDQALQDPGDLVVAAGGDGTVGKVAARLVGRFTPLAILALGTANNVAAGLGLPVVPEPAGMVFDWKTAPLRRLDVGVAHGPWGTRHFVESFGIGLLAHAMPVLSALKKRRPPASPSAALEHDRHGLAGLLENYVPLPLALTVDGVVTESEPLLVEVLNMPALGPRLRLAPDADPSDGQLALVEIDASTRSAAADWIVAGDDRVPPVPSRPVRSLSFCWAGEP
ncbi:MAG: diacylglycerol/lipid kinase family protein, partial [Gemmatimonadota bacterium]